MKKLFCIILSLVMLLCCFLPTVAAATAEKLPIIYIVGKQNSPVYKTDENGDWILDENGKKIQIDNVNRPMGMSREDYILSQVEPVLKELAPALSSGNYDSYIQSLIDAFAPVYADAVLDKNGEDPDGRIDWDYSVQQPQGGMGGFKYYYFRYDWRYSPYETADDLNTFVEYVCKKEGVEKVNIHARCYGSNVAAAYIAKSEAGYYDAPFRVKNLVLNTTPIAGYIIVGALMSGSITFTADNIDRYITILMNNQSIFEDPVIDTFVMMLVSALNQAKVLGWGTDKVQEIYDAISDKLIPGLALASYGSFPSYWSMISDEYYEKAKLKVFGTTLPEGEYAGFIEKIDNYHNLLGAFDEESGEYLYASLLKRCEEEYGMKTAVFAKYGFASFPFFEGSELTGDARGTVTELSLGAMGTVLGETFTDEELAAIKAMEDYDERYLAADNKVYAGTCLFPETTWFSKNMAHDQLNLIDPIATAFFLSDGTFTVHDDENYPQFHEYIDGYFVPVEEADATDSLWSDNPIVVFMNFVMALLEFLLALKDEIMALLPVSGTVA